MGEMMNTYVMSLLSLVCWCGSIVYMWGLMLGMLNEYFGGYSGVQGMSFYWLCWGLLVVGHAELLIFVLLFFPFFLTFIVLSSVMLMCFLLYLFGWFDVYLGPNKRDNTAEMMFMMLGVVCMLGLLGLHLLL